MKKCATSPPGHRFIFGLDANTYERANADQQDVNEFQTDAVKKGMVSQRGSGARAPSSSPSVSDRARNAVAVLSPAVGLLFETCVGCCRRRRAPARRAR